MASEFLWVGGGESTGPCPYSGFAHACINQPLRAFVINIDVWCYLWIFMDTQYLWYYTQKNNWRIFRFNFISNIQYNKI